MLYGRHLGCNHKDNFLSDIYHQDEDHVEELSRAPFVEEWDVPVGVRKGWPEQPDDKEAAVPDVDMSEEQALVMPDAPTDATTQPATDAPAEINDLPPPVEDTTKDE